MTILVFDMETIQRPLPKELVEDIRSGDVSHDYRTKDPRAVMENISRNYWKTFEGSQPVAIGFGIADTFNQKMVEPRGIQTLEQEELVDFIFDTFNDIKPLKVVGFNSKRFDMPILSYVCSFSERRFERPIGKWDHIDVAEHIPQFFTTFRKLKGLASSCREVFGIKQKLEVDGSDVKTMLEVDIKNGTKEVLKYCMDDVRITGELFLRLSKTRVLG